MQTKRFNENIEELLVLAKAGDKSAMDIIVEENIGLVHSAVKRFYGRGIDSEDLFQIGCIGLVKSVQKFDLSYNVKFSTYAVPMIMGEIKRFIRDDGIIKVSRSVKELAIKALALREKIINETGNEPTVQMLAQKLGVSAEEVAVALDAGIKPESIYAPYGNGEKEGKTLAERIESRDDCEGEVINKILVKQLLEDFEPREQKIIILRYFKQHTQAQIAAQMGISQVQVSRIEKKLLAAMREKLLL